MKTTAIYAKVNEDLVRAAFLVYALPLAGSHPGRGIDMSPSVVVSLVILVLGQPTPSPRPVSPPTREHEWGPDLVVSAGYGGRFGASSGEIRPAPGGDLYACWNWYLAHSFLRVTRAGDHVFALDGGDETTRQRFAVDGSGGILDVYAYAYPDRGISPADIVFWRVTPAGMSEPVGSHYRAHEPTPSVSEQFPSAATDPTGGAYIAWFRPRVPGDAAAPSGYFLQRVTTAGTIAPGWSPAGRRILQPAVFGYAEPALLSDGSAGLYMLASADILRLWRVESDTTMAPGWPGDGVAVSTNPYGGGLQPSDLALVAGSAGHTFAVWVEWESGKERLAARSFDGDGHMDGPVLGLSPLTDGYTIYLRAAQGDGQGGLLVQWRRQGVIEFAHVLANGTIAAGPIPVTTEPHSTAVVTMRPDGGFLVVRSAYGVGMLAQRYLADGKPVPNTQLLQAGEDVFPLAAYPDGDGGAFVLFGDGHYYSGVYMRHALSPTLAVEATAEGGTADVSMLDAGPPSPASRLSLAVAPNPARGELRLSVTLVGEQEASIELLDIAGRRLLTQTLPAGGTARERALELPSGLSAGVYLVRLRQGSQAALQRVAIIR